MKKSLQETLYRNYLSSLGDELVEVKEEERKPSEAGQVRLFFMTPPEFVLVIKKEEDLSLIVPLTSYIQLAITDRYPPVVRWNGYNLVPLPFWVYANDKLLEKYSVPVFKLRELDQIREYVKTARTKGIGEWREKFIRKTAERFQDLNLSSLLYEVIREEDEGTHQKVIKLPESIVRRLESREDLRLAAEPKSALRGENWTGVVEGGRLTLYLPKGYAGKRIKITLGQETLYEGEATERVIIEGLPDIHSFSFLEEELDVQLLGD